MACQRTGSCDGFANACLWLPWKSARLEQSKQSRNGLVREDKKEDCRENTEQDCHDCQRRQHNQLALIDLRKALVFRFLGSKEHPLDRPEHVASGEDDAKAANDRKGLGYGDKRIKRIGSLRAEVVV